MNIPIFKIIDIFRIAKEFVLIISSFASNHMQSSLILSEDFDLETSELIKVFYIFDLHVTKLHRC